MHLQLAPSSRGQLAQNRQARASGHQSRASRGPVPCQAAAGAEPGRLDVNRRAVLGVLTTSVANVFVGRSRADELTEALVGSSDSLPAPGADAAALSVPERAAPAPPAAKPATKSFVRELSDEERLLLEQNQRIKALNRAPSDFPAFIRKGYNVTVLADGYTYEPNGLIYKDYTEGTGPQPTDGQQVTFHYTAYNESGGKIDSSFNKGQPAQTRLGINGMIPGFEEALKSMRAGGRRRVIVPPELGPPVGPSTFFSAKQFEVFDVELLDVKSCQRVTSMVMFSNVVCS